MTLDYLFSVFSNAAPKVCLPSFFGGFFQDHPTATAGLGFMYDVFPFAHS
jgi:hypothetical protein